MKISSSDTAGNSQVRKHYRQGHAWLSTTRTTCPKVAITEPMLRSVLAILTTTSKTKLSVNYWLDLILEELTSKLIENESRLRRQNNLHLTWLFLKLALFPVLMVTNQLSLQLALECGSLIGGWPCPSGHVDHLAYVMLTTHDIRHDVCQTWVQCSVCCHRGWVDIKQPQGQSGICWQSHVQFQALALPNYILCSHTTSGRSNLTDIKQQVRQFSSF